jgi:hypothetical protein
MVPVLNPVIRVNLYKSAEYHTIMEFLPYMESEVRLRAHVSPSLDANLKEQSLI